tara:strand:+ start:429 stop:632 length:204 start_codon:yes stop_codon:yes gene_type:complete
MQADINSLVAHYNDLSNQMDEIQEQIKLLRTAMHSLIGGDLDNVGKVKLTMEDRTPALKPRTKRKKI